MQAALLQSWGRIKTVENLSSEEAMKILGAFLGLLLLLVEDLVEAGLGIKIKGGIKGKSVGSSVFCLFSNE